MQSYDDTNVLKNKLDWAKSFNRSFALPLDRSSMFASKTDAEDYAKGDGSDSRSLGKTSYIGQIITVYENDVVDVYVIGGDRTLIKLASGSSTEEVERKLSELSSTLLSTDGIVDQLSDAISTITDVTLPLSVGNLESNLSVALTSTTGTGDVLKTYHLSQGGVEVGTIDIPKDYLVKDAKIDTVTEADKAEGGKFYDNLDFEVGDKYIDFTINTAEGGGTEKHIYINIKTLVNDYTGGTTTTISVGIDNTNKIYANIQAGSISRSLLSTDLITDLTNISTDINTVSTDLNTEVARAEEAEAALETVIGNVSADLSETISNVSSDLNTAIANEVSRATAVEGALDSKIDGLSGEFRIISSDLNTAITEEAAARFAEDSTLSGLISTEAATARAAEQANATAIENEISRATAKEGVLSGKIDAETTARSAADDVLQTNIDTLSTSVNAKIDAAVEAAEQAIDALDTRIDTNAAAITAETDRALTVEDALGTRIDNEATAREDAIEGLSSELKGDIADIIDNYALSADVTAISSSLFQKIVTDAAAAKAAGELSAQTVRNDLTGYVKYTDVKTTVTSTNKVVTEEDIKDLSSVMHFIGTATVLDGETPQQALVRTFPNAKKGDVAIIENSGAEYVYVGDTAGDPEAWHVIGDEGTYATKAELTIVDNKVNAHIDDGDRHVTTDDKANWNAKATSADVSAIADAYRGIEEARATGIEAGLRADVNTLSTQVSSFSNSWKESVDISADALCVELSTKVFIKDAASAGYEDGKYTNLSVIKVSEEEYMEKVADGTLLSNGVLYVISSDHINAYGQKIVNVADPTELSDAANKKYVDAEVAKVKAVADESISTVWLNGLQFEKHGNHGLSLQIDLISCGNSVAF